MEPKLDLAPTVHRHRIAHSSVECCDYKRFEGRPFEWAHPSEYGDTLNYIHRFISKPEDLDETDKIAANVIEKLMKNEVPEHVRQQYFDNKKWIENAAANHLVVGSQARILYSDQEGRIAIALAFNDAVRDGRVTVSSSSSNQMMSIS
ncbi:unnamed protein product [Strongylus vulgaris]|uniref:Urocanase C-terminal domain-containing protein n=1 Tax=Strongylus vulgaris TaxID=40348 RepID=A0A3P7IB18_STRVU|nr:unnamed protein product [Strongylus vulgaris]